MTEALSFFSPTRSISKREQFRPAASVLVPQMNFGAKTHFCQVCARSWSKFLVFRKTGGKLSSDTEKTLCKSLKPFSNLALARLRKTDRDRAQLCQPVAQSQKREKFKPATSLSAPQMKFVFFWYFQIKFKHLISVYLFSSSSFCKHAKTLGKSARGLEHSSTDITMKCTIVLFVSELWFQKK